MFSIRNNVIPKCLLFEKTGFENVYYSEKKVFDKRGEG